MSRFTNLTFDSPLALLQAPGDSARWFVVQQDGAVQQFTGTNPASASLFIDITSRVRSGGEMGLLGMAFHPNFPTDSRVFLSYTTGNSPLVSRISSFRSNDGGATLDPTSETILMTIDQPETNHNGGHIAFGPDGYLYIGMGDGGGGGDAHGDRGNGQRLTTLLGKLLRIDVDGAAPYTIPPSNPFVANAVCPPAGRSSGECPEIYAYGFRNPWRWNFDRSNGDLWLADVGQGDWEEVNQVTIGGNYGWRCREGAHDYNAGTPGCSTATLTDPVTEYNHSLGNSITGGYVYRGSQSTALLGRYLFGDFGSGRIWAWIAENGAANREPTQLLDTELNIASFGQGNDGELYVLNYGGTLHRINFEASGVVNTAPRLLSDTGCVSSSDPKQPAAGFIPYAINAPFWSDGADKDRWMALPNGQNITVQASGDWNFPNGTVLMKNFRIGTRLIETRLFMRHPDGVWGGFSYEWNAEQTQATLLEGGAMRDLGEGRTWIFPSEGQCLECHTEAAGRALGLETAQLNRTFAYPQTNRTANELTTLNHIGMLTPAIADAAAQPALPDPAGSAPIADRARAYLHTNCAQCHRPGGPTPSNMDLRYPTSLMGTNACDVLPASGDLGLGANARLIAPGDSANSLLVYRMNRRDASGMPPLGSTTVDATGVSLLAQWIDGLAACQ
ncbi:MAG TPA: PQQ-dependent sugar dehydrogenase [Steroidobacter sp.]|uniref:PQQ-dependent sugar dehydrogenase n=1 Tax=Steroidobacter sp. TaxID=1978227 RepID=UPI002EDAD91C